MSAARCNSPPLSVSSSLFLPLFISFPLSLSLLRISVPVSSVLPSFLSVAAYLSVFVRCCWVYNSACVRGGSERGLWRESVTPLTGTTRAATLLQITEVASSLPRWQGNMSDRDIEGVLHYPGAPAMATDEEEEEEEVSPIGWVVGGSRIGKTRAQDDQSRIDRV